MTLTEGMAEYHRGYEDGRHGMDAEHRAVAMRLRALRFDDGNHENLSNVAYAIYPEHRYAWTPSACAALRDKLIDLMGGVSDENVHVGGLCCDDGCMGDVSNGEDTGRAHDSPSNLDRNHMAVREGVDTVIGDSDDTCCCAGGGACADCDCDDSGEQTEVTDERTTDDCGVDTDCGDGGGDLHMAGIEPTATVTGDGLTITSEDGDELRIVKDDILLNGKSIVKESIDGLLGLTATYDVLDNERRKAVCELQKLNSENFGCKQFMGDLLSAIDPDWISKASMYDDATLNEYMRDRLIHLLGGDQPSGIDVLRAMNSDGTSPNDDGTCPNDVTMASITEELRELIAKYEIPENENHKWFMTSHDQRYIVTKAYAIADRIDEQFERICKQQEAVLQSTIDTMVDERDKLADNRDMWRGKAMQLTDVVDRYVGRCDDLLDLLRDAAADFKNASYGWNYASVVGENIVIETERNRLLKERDKLRDECVKMKRQYAELCVERANLLDLLRDARDEYKTLDRVSSETSANFHAMRDRVWSLEMERDELQAKLDEYDSTYVELPKDANGEVFRVGCAVRMVERHPEVLLTVHRMTLCDDGMWWLYAWDDKDEYSCNLSTSEFEVHDMPCDTAESIVRDLSIGSITESEAVERIEALNG